MRLQLMVIAAALALGACDRPNEKSPPPAGASAPSSGATAPSTPPAQANTPTTPAPPASTGATASQAEKKEGANPTQGQVDPKHSDQQRDFKQKGDAAGPTSPETKPKSGG